MILHDANIKFGFVHGDLHRGNILIEKHSRKLHENVIQLIDFNMSTFIINGVTFSDNLLYELYGQCPTPFSDIAKFIIYEYYLVKNEFYRNFFEQIFEIPFNEDFEDFPYIHRCDWNYKKIYDKMCDYKVT
jgi:hypothetical protein